MRGRAPFYVLVTDVELRDCGVDRFCGILADPPAARARSNTDNDAVMASRRLDRMRSRSSRAATTSGRIDSGTSGAIQGLPLGQRATHRETPTRTVNPPA